MEKKNIVETILNGIKSKVWEKGSALTEGKTTVMLSEEIRRVQEKKLTFFFTKLQKEEWGWRTSKTISFSIEIAVIVKNTFRMIL